MIELVRGNIVDEESDAIVNAANGSLLGGGGVDGAIHTAAGPALLAECRKLGGCATGAAKLTAGYRLRAQYIIHAVGPVYRGTKNDALLLASAYDACLEIARAQGFASVSFPAISTGIYGYPLEEAAPIALTTVREAMQRNPKLSRVRFVLFSTAALRAYERAHGSAIGKP